MCGRTTKDQVLAGAIAHSVLVLHPLISKWRGSAANHLRGR